MSKERRAVSLDPEVDAFLSRDEVNASGLVNDLVKRHMNGDAGEEALRELRERQIQSEIESHKTEAERLQEELETIREVAEEADEEREANLQDAIDKAANVDRDPENPAIQTQAKRVGMTPEEFIDELPEQDDDSDLRSL